MSGGGKGGEKTQQTEIPQWLRDPATRNLARAEAVQQLPYMPYYGADVAAFTPTQNAAFDANIGAAEAFGLIAPNTLTATSGMPTPTDYDGFSGYSSQPMYESALAELKAQQPGAVGQYNTLFGNYQASGGGSSGGGSPFRGYTDGGGSRAGFDDSDGTPSGYSPSGDRSASWYRNRNPNDLVAASQEAATAGDMHTAYVLDHLRWRQENKIGDLDIFNTNYPGNTIVGTDGKSYTIPSDKEKLDAGLVLPVIQKVSPYNLVSNVIDKWQQEDGGGAAPATDTSTDTSSGFSYSGDISDTDDMGYGL